MALSLEEPILPLMSKSPDYMLIPVKMLNFLKTENVPPTGLNNVEMNPIKTQRWSRPQDWVDLVAPSLLALVQSYVVSLHRIENTKQLQCWLASLLYSTMFRGGRPVILRLSLKCHELWSNFCLTLLDWVGPLPIFKPIFVSRRMPYSERPRSGFLNQSLTWRMKYHSGFFQPSSSFFFLPWKPRVSAPSSFTMAERGWKM